MEIKEAIRLLDPMTTVEAMAEIEYYAGFSGKEAKIKAIDDACEIACEALEKQIPKKVVKRMCLNCDKTSCPEECENYSDLCPNCGSHLSNDVDFEYPNCPYCTQNLDWSDTE